MINKAKEEPLVSIIVPVYNAGPLIQEAIETVKKQTHENWELLLIDDMSFDTSIELMEREEELDPRIRLIKRRTNGGAARARNTGIDTASGSYIAFLDADDLWHPRKLEKQIGFMEKTRQSLSFTSYQFINANTGHKGGATLVPEKISYKDALKRSSIFTSTVMVDLNKVSKKDLKMPYYPIGEDTATWWNILKKYGDAAGMQQTLSYYRRSEGSLSGNKLKAAIWRWRLYRKHEKISIIKSIYYYGFYVKYAIERRV